MDEIRIFGRKYNLESSEWNYGIWKKKKTSLDQMNEIMISLSEHNQYHALMWQGTRSSKSSTLLISEYGG